MARASKPVTLKLSKSLGACGEQVELFRELFGGQVILTAELVEKYASQFDIDWLAYRALQGPALAEYEKVRGTALAEYEKACGTAWAEYEKVRGTALAKYKKVTLTAWAEYEKVRGTAFMHAWDSQH